MVVEEKQSTSERGASTNGKGATTGSKQSIFIRVSVRDGNEMEWDLQARDEEVKRPAAVVWYWVGRSGSVWTQEEAAHTKTELHFCEN